MNVLEDLKSVCCRKINFTKIPVTSFGYNEQDIKKFNQIYRFIIKHIHKKITRTKSGGICVKEEEIRGNQYDIRHTTTIIELTFKYESRWYRVQIGYKKKTDDDKKVYGTQAWKIFLRLCKKYDIDITKFKLESKEKGLEEKSQICKPLIEFGEDGKENKIYENCHHLDFNSSYAYGISNYVPDLKPVIEEIYYKRNTHEEYKNVLAILHGYMQSECVHYLYSDIARFANQDNRDRVLELALKLKASGKKIILFNTDGIWYQDDEMYHDENEGTELGKWKHDYINCKLRCKSKGCYEIIGTKVKTNETKYFPFLRGSTTYERQVPRDKWKWGDIYKGSTLEYEFIPGVGLIEM